MKAFSQMLITNQKLKIFFHTASKNLVININNKIFYILNRLLFIVETLYKS